MGIRRLARQRALQLLYSLEYSHGKPFDEAESDYLGGGRERRKGWSPFAHELARKTWVGRRELDNEIRPALKRWSVARLSRVDRLCLRMALCEMKFFDQIPLRVTLNEYIELARVFGGDESPQFVNGVLDALAKAYPHKDFQSGDEKVGDAPDPAEDADLDEAIDEDRSGAGPEENLK